PRRRVSRQRGISARDIQVPLSVNVSLHKSRPPNIEESSIELASQSLHSKIVPERFWLESISEVTGPKGSPGTGEGARKTKGPFWTTPGVGGLCEIMKSPLAVTTIDRRSICHQSALSVRPFSHFGL